MTRKLSRKVKRALLAAQPDLFAQDPAHPHPVARPNRSVFVIGCQKGGCGKTTVAIHLTVALLRLGHRVGVIDLDWPQATLTRYLENRERFSAAGATDLQMPDYVGLEPSGDAGEDAEALRGALADMQARSDMVVIDTPGALGELALAAHAEADVLITPLNDSLIDLDVLGQIDRDRPGSPRPSHYAEAVWRARQARALQGRRPIDWIVMRNRLASLDARNKREVARILDAIAPRFGFRQLEGFSERVIYRELFAHGLTVLDPGADEQGVGLSLSHLSARQEIRELIEALGLVPAAAPASAAPPAA